MSTAARPRRSSSRPRASIEERVFRGTLRAADYLLWGEIEVLKTAELTFPQYNVLRILRGAEPDGVSCREISERMVTRDSDITRLLDRLEARGLVARGRNVRDRRIIVTRISREGLDLLRALDDPVEQVHREQLKHMSRTDLEELVKLLERARRSTAG
jgi:DNA-binding MarR family transcriptional regulator